MAETAEILRAPYTLEYAYKRSLGPVMSAFLTGLRDGRFVATRTKGGRVLMPPAGVRSGDRRRRRGRVRRCRRQGRGRHLVLGSRAS